MGKYEINGIELFGGCGGLALGLEKAGVKSKAIVEFNKTACETLRVNRPEWNVIEGDIHDISFKKYNGDEIWIQNRKRKNTKRSCR